MNENKNKITTSGVSNVLNGVRVFILGMLVTFFFFLPIFLFGLGLINLGPVGETWSKQSITLILIAIGYGLLSYILGKTKPTMFWKSGFLFILPLIIMPEFGLVSVLRDFASSQRNLEPKDLFLILPFVIAIVVALLSFYLGSRSKRTWQGKFLTTVFGVDPDKGV